MKNKSGHKPICRMQLVREERQSEVTIMSIKKSPYSWFRKQRKRKSEKHTRKTPPDPSSHIMLTFTSATNNPVPTCTVLRTSPFFPSCLQEKNKSIGCLRKHNWYQEQPDNILKLQISVWHDSWYENPMIPKTSKIPDSSYQKSMISWYENPQFLIWKILFPAKKPFTTPSDGPPNFVFSLITRIEHHQWKKKARFRV
jgi:hypothetical protein